MQELTHKDLRETTGGHPILIAIAAGFGMAAVDWASEHFMDGYNDPCGQG